MDNSIPYQPSYPSVDVYDMELLEQRLKSSHFKKEPERYQKQIIGLHTAGAQRRLAEATDGKLQLLEKLKNYMPHFSDVIDFIKGYMVTALISRTPAVYFPPLCISGEAGVGKTYFTEYLIKILKTESHFISCAGTNSDFVITGLDRGYGTGYLGRIAQHFLEQKTGNPIFVLDEFEKPKPNYNNGQDFHNAFYTLMEKDSAARFEDQYLKLNFNTRYINWICTVNDFSELPLPIQSRLTHFFIRAPDGEFLRKVVCSIYAKEVSRQQAEHGLIFRSQLNAGEQARLKDMPPRQIKQVIQQAMQAGVMNAYNADPVAAKREGHLFIPDLDGALRQMENVSRSRGIGFLAAL